MGWVNNKIDARLTSPKDLCWKFSPSKLNKNSNLQEFYPCGFLDFWHISFKNKL